MGSTVSNAKPSEVAQQTYPTVVNGGGSQAGTYKREKENYEANAAGNSLEPKGGDSTANPDPEPLPFTGYGPPTEQNSSYQVLDGNGDVTVYQQVSSNPPVQETPPSQIVYVDENGNVVDTQSYEKPSHVGKHGNREYRGGSRNESRGNAQRGSQRGGHRGNSRPSNTFTPNSQQSIINAPTQNSQSRSRGRGSLQGTSHARSRGPKQGGNRNNNRNQNNSNVVNYNSTIGNQAAYFAP
ncbi:hypothetical protein [Methanobrevibacter sp.]